MCFYRGRNGEFKDFFSQEAGVLFCNDVCSVTEVLDHEYNPHQWGFFICSSKVSLNSTTDTDFHPLLWLMQPTLTL